MIKRVVSEARGGREGTYLHIKSPALGVHTNRRRAIFRHIRLQQLQVLFIAGIVTGRGTIRPAGERNVIT